MHPVLVAAMCFVGFYRKFFSPKADGWEIHEPDEVEPDDGWGPWEGEGPGSGDDRHRFRPATEAA